MNVDRFAQQLEATQGRLAKLYQEGSSILPVAQQPGVVRTKASPLLPSAFRELGTASEELQVAVEELRQQNEELAAARQAVEAERQRYQDLFEFAPDGYLVTDVAGTIRQANRAAASLLNVSQQFLVGKPLITFIPQAERQGFRAALNQVDHQIGHPDGSTVHETLPRWHQEWEVHLQPRHSQPFVAALSVSAAYEPQGNLLTLRWLLRNITTAKQSTAKRKQAEALLGTKDTELSNGFAAYGYTKGESIPLNAQVIWQVSQGLVKLSTFCETGEEVLVGIAGPLTLFGPSLTALHTFQATALSDVQLVCLTFSEIAGSPSLSLSLLPLINQRLRQTEALLAVAGERRVENRLYHLLRVLKQQIGQPIAQGTRLSVRLTHEDLANACCSTRVTVTRLLSKLQQQGKLTFCPKRHIILTEGDF